MKAKDGMGRSGGVRRWMIPLLGFALLGATAMAWAMDGVRERELVRLVREDCGSCHGLTLKGGLGPPLLPETLQDKPEQYVVLTILHGHPGTPMPPWSPFMNETEAAWIASRLKAGFPDR
ncbi:MAG: cytochrome c [Rhodocyclaceae bacterium]|nr:cytochrome c [Rhodocyclaceae bacterium]